MNGFDELEQVVEARAGDLPDDRLEVKLSEGGGLAFVRDEHLESGEGQLAGLGVGLEGEDDEVGVGDQEDGVELLLRQTANPN